MERTLGDLLAHTEQRLAVCQTFVLLWLATVEGDLPPGARDYFARQLQPAFGTRNKLDALLDIIAAHHLDSFLLACRTIKRELNSDGKTTFLDAAISIAMADNHLTIPANHILRLFNDLLGFTTDDLSQRFKTLTGQDLPEPGDPSSIRWWELRDTYRIEEQSAQQGRTKHNGTCPPGHFSRAEAFAVLGLDHEASHGQIKKAYRRLVQNYHPDRYQHMGADARGAAELNFLRVQRAYEVLKQ